MKRWTLVKVLVSVAVVAYIVFRFPLAPVAEVLAAASPWWLAVAVAAKAAAVLGSAIVWRAALPSPTRPTLPQAARVYFASLHAGLPAPGNLGADIYRVAASGGRNGIDHALAAILSERVVIGAAYLVAVAAGAWLAPEAAPWRKPLGALALAAGAMVAAGVGGGQRAAAIVPGTRFASRAARAVLRALAGLSRRNDIGAVAAAALVPVFTTASVIAVFLAVDHPLELRFAVFAATASALIVFVPLSVQGIGIREGAYLAIFSRIGGLPYEVALAASIGSLATTVAVAVLGGIALWLPSRPTSQPLS